MSYAFFRWCSHAIENYWIIHPVNGMRGPGWGCRDCRNEWSYLNRKRR